MKTMTRAWFMTAAALALGVAAVLAPLQDAHAATPAEMVKERMQARLPRLDALKARGILGENNSGRLAVLAVGNRDADELAAAENADRLAVYAAIAARTGATPAAVGVLRAAKIAESAPPGTKIQGADGKWKSKGA